MSRPAPPINGSRPGGGKGVAKFKRKLSPEARANLSEQAKKRHAESDGHGFGRGELEPHSKPKRKPPKARISQLVAEAAREKANAESIVDVFKDGVHSTQPIHIRLKAAEAWIKVENEDAKIAMREDESASVKRDRKELIEMLSEKLSSGPTAALLRRQLAESSETIDDDDIIDVDPNDVEEEFENEDSEE